VKYSGNVLPLHKNANFGDLVVFECKADVAEWYFNYGPLPQGSYSMITILTKVYSLAVIIHDDTYFGDYSCQGELFHEDLVFYDVVTLSPLPAL